MPDYEFECKKCGEHFEKHMTIKEHDEEKVHCPKCDSEEVEHVFESVFVTTSKKS